MSININNYGNCFPFFVIHEITCMYVNDILLDSGYQFFIYIWTLYKEARTE